MNPCKIKYRGKKRTGDYRYWCIVHSKEIVTDNFMCPIICDHLDYEENQNHIELNISDWAGGVGVWGAMKPIYSTHSSEGHENGIHIHAREEKNGKKVIDGTYDQLTLFDHANLFETEVPVVIKYETALSYTASNVFGIDLKCLKCTHCNTFHSDEGIYAVTPHKKHLCLNCGKHFNDSEHGVSNPIIEFKTRLQENSKEFAPKMSSTPLKIYQKDYPAGIQIWGSNPAMLWSVDKNEETGIHVHIYNDPNSDSRIIDDTFGSVVIDDLKLDHQQVRYYMVQQYLSDVFKYVTYLECPNCLAPHFDKLENARTPHNTHLCHSCGEEFVTKKSIGNPIVKVLEKLKMNYEDLQK
jgi:transposase-like protein